MKYLLDTHVLLWAASSPEKLSEPALATLVDKENILYFSAASMWEIVIKNQLRRQDFLVDARLLRRGLLENGYLELPITSEHAIAIEALMPIHKDPFDRILLAQAQVEGFSLLTADAYLANYPGIVKAV